MDRASAKSQGSPEKKADARSSGSPAWLVKSLINSALLSRNSLKSAAETGSVSVVVKDATHSAMKVNVMHGSFQKNQNLRNEFMVGLSGA